MEKNENVVGKNIKSKEKAIAVIIVNYNGYNDTKECLNSLRKVSTSNMFVIIVDNGSTDNSPNKLKEFVMGGKEFLICINNNLGFSGGNNYGIQYAINKGAEYICLLNNDTVVESDFLDKMLEKVEDDSVVYGKIKFFCKPDRIWFAGGVYNRWTGKTVHLGYNQIDGQEEKGNKSCNFVTGCLLLIPALVIKKIGGLPEHYFLYYEDTEYSLRLIENGIKLKYAPDAIIYHKVSASTQKQPNRVIYYSIRNSLLMVSEHEKGLRKISAVFCISVRNIKRMITGVYNPKIVKIAYHDWIMRKFGKCQELI